MKEKSLLLCAVVLLCMFGVKIGESAEMGKSTVEVKANLEARKQAELSYQKGREAYDQGNYYLAADYFEKGIGVVGYSEDPALAISPLAKELYVRAFVVNETLGMDLLKKGFISEKTAEYFKKVIIVIQQLDKGPDTGLKKEIDDSLPAEKKLSGFLANCYYNLGMIYDALGKKDLKNEYIQKLRSLGRSDWADEVERGYKAD